MRDKAKPIIILLADDDEEDRMLACEALAESRLSNEIYCVCDGEDLLNYLRREGKYAPPAEAPRPGLILLDLNMPRKDGREALREIKADPMFRHIPVVVMTTSKAEEDVLQSYDCGASSYIPKAVTFDSLVDVMKSLGLYWFEIVELPSEKSEEVRV